MRQRGARFDRICLVLPTEIITLLPMKALVLAIALLAACNADDQKPPTEVGKIVVEMCGEPPLAPGWAVQSNGDTVTMTTTDYTAINKWREDVAAWRDCVTNLP